MVLIITNRWDLSADFVVRGLRDRGVPMLRLNSEDLVLGGATLTLPELALEVNSGDGSRSLKDVRVVWHRRPGKPFDAVAPEDRPSAAVQRFVEEQWFAWLEAVELLPEVTWINPPPAAMAMESKPRQLKLAAECGLKVPPTCITSSASTARRFATEQGGRVIAKALFKPLIEEPEADSFVFANVVGVDDLTEEEEFRLAPVILQPALHPKDDYRVTVVGDQILVARLERGAGGPIDWRRDRSDVRFVLDELPQHVNEGLLRFMRKAGLVFGAIDLVRYKEEFYFLEINPNGEWGWLQKPHGIPVADALCDYMAAAASAG